MSGTVTRVALEQVEAIPGRFDENTDSIVERAAALRQEADIVVFPELADTGYITDLDLISRGAQAVDGPLVARLSRAVAGSPTLVATGLCERDGADFFNTVVLVGGDGPVDRYRKTHLFDNEHDVYSAGRDLPVVTTEHGAIGLCICYDLRFVEVMRVLALRGADIVIAPAAWVAGFDPHVPQKGPPQQAIGAVVQANLNQVAVVAVSQVSTGRANGVRTIGGSVAANAYGEIVAGPLSRSTAESAVATFDLDQIRSSRERAGRIRPRDDRRTDIYRVAYGSELL